MDIPSRAPTFEELEYDMFMEHSTNHDYKVKDLKTFTKICNLSAPTVKKWLNGQTVYKSTLHKLEKALIMCDLTKDDLQKMRRTPQRSNSFDFDSNNYEFPSLKPREIQIQSHFVHNGAVHYVCQIDSNYVYEPISSCELTTYDDQQAIIKYWESLLIV